MVRLPAAAAQFVAQTTAGVADQVQAVVRAEADIHEIQVVPVRLYRGMAV